MRGASCTTCKRCNLNVLHTVDWRVGAASSSNRPCNSSRAGISAGLLAGLRELADVLMGDGLEAGDTGGLDCLTHVADLWVSCRLALVLTLGWRSL